MASPHTGLALNLDTRTVITSTHPCKGAGVPNPLLPGLRPSHGRFQPFGQGSSRREAQFRLNHRNICIYASLIARSPSRHNHLFSQVGDPHERLKQLRYSCLDSSGYVIDSPKAPLIVHAKQKSIYDIVYENKVSKTVQSTFYNDIITRKQLGQVDANHALTQVGHILAGTIYVE